MIAPLVERILTCAPPSAVVSRDKLGNVWVDNRRDDAATMFQAHLDTVGPDDGVHEIFLEADGKVHTSGQHVLGADDGAGIAILCALLLADVPALYLFTQGEECGGIGGGYAAMHEAHRIEGIARCIAFDRRGTGEICGEQCMGSLASPRFVRALSQALGLGHVWGTGTYTDNSEWVGQILEIVNVSVGYSREHSKEETLDYTYWCALRAAVIALDWEALPTEGPVSEDSYRDTFAGYRPGDWCGTFEGEGEWAETVREALWDICDTMGLDERDIETSIIRESLERLARQVAGGVTV
jgi:hypothetical protein